MKKISFIKIFSILFSTIILGLILYQISLGYIATEINQKTIRAKSISALTHTPYGPIINNQKIQQNFTALYSNLESVEVNIGNANRNLSGKTCFELKNITQNNIFYYKCLLNANFINDSYYNIKFNEQKNIINDKISLFIYSQVKNPNSGIYLFTYNTGYLNNYKLYINNKIQPQTLDFNQIYKTKSNNIETVLVSKINTVVPYNPITKNIIISQYFKSKYNNLYELEFLIGNYNRLNTSLLCFKLSNITLNRNFYNKCFSSTDFVNNSYYKIPFTAQNNTKNDLFLIKIYSPNATNTNSVTVFLYNNNINKEILKINNKSMISNIDFIQSYKLNLKFNQIFKIFYKQLYSSNPNILNKSYILLIIFLFPIILIFLIYYIEILLLYDKTVFNIIITNIILILIILFLFYINNNVKNLTIACYYNNTSCVVPIS